MANNDTEVVDIDGRRLKLTNLDKVMYPATGTTKAEVIHYYATIADVMLPHTRGRPATRKRWVHGVGTEDEPGEVFFQKNLDSSAPDWLHRGTITHKTSTNTYPLVDDRATLVWLAQIASLEIHVPQWRFGRNGQPRNPDRMVLDLDPGEGVTLSDCAEVARYARDILTDMGLDPLPVTSGSKGIHLYAALDGSQNSDAVSAVAHELARALEADHPDLVVSDMKRAIRAGKVFVDWSQNNAAKTTIAPYSLRGRLHPTVAAPRTWKELEAKDLAHLDFEEVLRRVKKRGDLLAGLSASGRRPACGRSRPPHVVPQQARRVEDTRARAGRGCTLDDRAHLRHPGAPRAATALGLPPGARWGTGQLGASEGSSDRYRHQPSRRARRRPPAGVRGLRGRHSARGIWRGPRRHLGCGRLRRREMA